MPKTVPVPDDDEPMIVWAMKNGRAAIELLNALAMLNAVLVPAQGAVELAKGKNNLAGDPPNILFPIPLKLATPIADSTATAASVSTQLNLLFAALRVTGMLPK